MADDADREGTLTFALDGGRVCLGRDPSCEIVLRGVGVSRRHAEIRLDPDGPAIEDTGSSFGLRVDGEIVRKAGLSDGSTFTIGISHFRVRLSGTTLELIPVHEEGKPGLVEHGATEGLVRIGRDPTCEVECPHPLVSRWHALLHTRADGACTIEDQQSTNGTFVNGRPVRRAELVDGDILQVGPYRFFLEQGRLVQADDYNRVRIEAVGVRVRRGMKSILDGVSLTIEPGEFVLLLGPSGAGKSTLAYALTGQVKLDEGDVFVNGMPLKQFSAAFSTSVGFVSQHNLLPGELTVREIFGEQSVLRLPADSQPAERVRRIDEVLELLDLGRVADKQVRTLSGGEAKRVHLGIELLASPAVIFLDEPLAGLDFGLVRSFMMLFRTLSDRGHTVLLTTHTLEQVGLCDRLLFLHRGALIYQGAPAGIGAALGVGDLAEVYDKVKRGDLAGAPIRAPAEGRESGTRSTRTIPLVRVRRHTGPPFARQVSLLVGRYLRIFVRDSRNLLLVLLQVPLIAVLLSLVFRGDTDFFPLSFYFALTVSAVWIGGVNAVREIAREWPIASREYRAGLSLTAYLSAKLVVFSALSSIQGLLFAVLLTACFRNFAYSWATALLLATGSVGGAVLGLAVSALSAGVNRAISLLPIVFIPQIFLAGALMPFDRMARPGEWLSHATLSRPVFALFKRTQVLDQSLWLRDEWLWLSGVVAGLSILAWVGVVFHVRRGGHDA